MIPINDNQPLLQVDVSSISARNVKEFNLRYQINIVLLACLLILKNLDINKCNNLPLKDVSKNQFQS